MAKQKKSPVYLSNEDVQDLCDLVYKNGCKMLSPDIRKHWAIAYNVHPSTVYFWVRKIIEASYQDSKGRWRLKTRPTIGKGTIISCVKETLSCIESGSSVPIKEISRSTGMTVNTIVDIIKDLKDD